MTKRSFLGAVALALIVCSPWRPAFAQPGCDVVVFWDANFRGEQMRMNHGTPYVGDHWNDQISSIQVLAGTWEFYWDANFRGEVLRLGPGSYPYVGDHWNDQISSMRCIGPG